MGLSPSSDPLAWGSSRDRGKRSLSPLGGEEGFAGSPNEEGGWSVAPSRRSRWSRCATRTFARSPNGASGTASILGGPVDGAPPLGAGSAKHSPIPGGSPRVSIAGGSAGGDAGGSVSGDGGSAARGSVASAGSALDPGRGGSASGPRAGQTGTCGESASPVSKLPLQGRGGYASAAGPGGPGAGGGFVSGGGVITDAPVAGREARFAATHASHAGMSLFCDRSWSCRCAEV